MGMEERGKRTGDPAALWRSFGRASLGVFVVSSNLGYLGDEFMVKLTIQHLSSVYDVAFDDDGQRLSFLCLKDRNNNMGSPRKYSDSGIFWFSDLPASRYLSRLFLDVF